MRTPLATVTPTAWSAPTTSHAGGESLQAALDAVPVAIAVLRAPELGIELANAAFRRLAPGREVAGRPLADACPAIADEVLPALRKGVGSAVEVPDVRVRDAAPGGDRHFAVTCAPLGADAGGRGRVLLTAVETTAHVPALRRAQRGRGEAQVRRRRKLLERFRAARRAMQHEGERLRAAEAALREASRRKDEFLAMLSHELRNPLAAITSAAHVIRLRLAQGRTAERPIAILERQAKHSARLLDDLLDVSRITRGAIDLEIEAVQLDAAVTEAVEAQAPNLEAAGLALSVALPPSPVLVRGDPTRLQQVVSNLVSNAAKYTDAGGRVELSLEVVGDEAVLRVKDTGIGMAPEFLPRVFEPFVQADTSLARPRGGLGLGLAVVRRLVEVHGGSVQARSAGPGRGSEFTVRLPLLPAGAERPAAGAAAPPVRTQRPRRVVLVEDEEDSAELIAEYLRDLGHEVAIAHDGLAGLALIERVRPDVVLLDIGLPGMDGYAVARRLRERGRAAHVVAMTGYGQESDKARAREAGFTHHLTKPFDPDDLARLIEALP